MAPAVGHLPRNKKMQKSVTIRTSESGWFQKLIEAYKNRLPFQFVDDANLGINLTDNLITVGLQAQLTFREWFGVLIALGVGAMGAFIIIAAIMDPEPNSKLVLVIATGAVLAFGGGGYAIHLLTNVRPPNIRISPSGVEVNWE